MQKGGKIMHESWLKDVIEAYNESKEENENA